MPTLPGGRVDRLAGSYPDYGAVAADNLPRLRWVRIVLALHLEGGMNPKRKLATGSLAEKQQWMPEQQPAPRGRPPKPKPPEPTSGSLTSSLYEAEGRFGFGHYRHDILEDL